MYTPSSSRALHSSQTSHNSSIEIRNRKEKVVVVVVLPCCYIPTRSYSQCTQERGRAFLQGKKRSQVKRRGRCVDDDGGGKVEDGVVTCLSLSPKSKTSSIKVSLG